jgi:hypothetical protein
MTLGVIASLTGVGVGLIWFAGCYAWQACLRSDYAYITGGDQVARKKAAVEIEFAAARFRATTGQDPALGLVRLERFARNPRIVFPRPTWSLTFDQTDALYQLRSAGVADAKRDVSPTLYGSHGVLGHEACHLMALHVESVRQLPPAIEEVIAVGCEPYEMRQQRMRQFKYLYSKGAALPWDQFIVMPHPLINSTEIRAAARTSAATGNIAFFRVPAD